ncbi:substrate-binding domain-containing protein [bacterium]|nr:substrate-binding domain-containing protein [bacterium]
MKEKTQHPGIQHFADHKIQYLCLILFVVFTVLGLYVISALKTYINAEDSVAWNLSRWIDIIFVGYGFCMLLLVFWMYRIRMKPHQKVIKIGRKISSEDMNAVSSAITELSQGNLSRQLEFNTKPIMTAGRASRMNEIVDIFNSMIRNLKDTAQAFNNVTGIPCKRLFYVGADSFLEGRYCGEIMGRILKGKGCVVVSAESFSATNLDLRRRGFLGLIREKYPGIEVVDFVEAKAGGGQAYRAAVEILKKFPNLSGIYIACGSPPAQFAKALVELHKAGAVKVICHDLMDDTMRWVKEGVITATLSQNSFAQGYNPIIHMFNHLAAGWKPPMPFLLTELQEVNQDNYRDFWSEEQGMILSAQARERMAKPVIDSAPKPLRMAVLGRDDTAFWLSIMTGSQEAVKVLQGHNVTVDCYAPKEVHRVHDFTIEIYGPLIERIIQDKYDGLITVAPLKTFIPYINRAVEAGIPVGLYNSDPSSLRAMIHTVTEQAQHLMGLSETLAGNTYQTSQATMQIRTAIEGVAQGSVSQNNQISKTEEALHNLLDTIELINREAEKSATATENTAKAVSAGTDAMNETLKTMKEIETSVTNAWGLVEELGAHSEKIDSVVELINDIASRVNVLALNASIEATKAGEYGAGFMVVAKAVRKLAKNTADATREVTDLIHTVQSDISKVERVMHDGLARMKQSASLADRAVTTLSDIQKMIQSDKERILNIARSMGNMQTTSHTVGTAMENVASDSENNMAAVEEVSALTKEMTAQLENVTELAHALELMARSEQQMLAKFILLEEKSE